MVSAQEWVAISNAFAIVLAHLGEPTEAWYTDTTRCEVYEAAVNGLILCDVAVNDLAESEGKLKAA